jgi:hypothetical protein
MGERQQAVTTGGEFPTATWRDRLLEPLTHQGHIQPIGRGEGPLHAKWQAEWRARGGRVLCASEEEARGERVVRIEEILRNPGDPGAPGDGRHDRGEIAN